MSARDFRAEPSGVDGLSPTEVRRAMRELGWTALLPIHSIDVAEPHKRGKVPSLLKWNDRCRFDGRATTDKDLAGWERREDDAPGTSIACGDIVGIDIDFEADAARGQQIEAIAFEVFGSTPFVRQGRAPKLLLVYRAAEPIGTLKFKAASGTGDGLDIVAEGFHFVAFGLHPKNTTSYAWIGAEDPLTAGPEGAPEITRDQVDEFLRRVGEIEPLVLTGSSSGGTGGHGGEAASVVRDASGLVTSGREEHLFAIVRSVTHELYDAGLPITAEAIVERAWARFAASTDIDRPRSSGKPWSFEDVEAKARATVDRLERGVFSLGSRPSAPAAEAGPEGVEPTYPDRTVSLEEARAATREAVRRFYVEAAAWDARKDEHEAREKEAKAAWKAGGRAKAEAEAAWFESKSLADWKAEGGHVAFRFPRFDEPPPVHLVAPDVGVGKTHAAADARAHEGEGLKTVFAYPNLALAEEGVKRHDEGHAIEGRVIRGRDASDPTASPPKPGELPVKMCRREGAVRIALALGKSVQDSCCARKIGKDENDDPILVKCPLYDGCSHVAQMKEAPDTLSTAHHMMSAGHEVFKDSRRLVVDETFTGALMREPSRGITPDAIAQPTNAADGERLRAKAIEKATRDRKTAGDPRPLDEDDLRRIDRSVAAAREDIDRRRRTIAAALRAQADAGLFGPVLRSFLIAENEFGAGLTEEYCREANRCEWALKPDADMSPNMSDEALAEAAAAAETFREIKARTAVFERLREFLALDKAKAGRVYIATEKTPAGTVTVVKVQGLDALSKTFEIPTLLLDATPPDEEIIRTFLPQVVIAPRIAVKTPQMRARQVLGAPVSKTKLGADKNRAAVRAAVLAEWVRLGREKMLVVAQKPFAKWLREDGKLPEEIAVGHYGAIVGTDQYRDVRGIVLVGREQPKAVEVEGIAGSLTGAYPDVIAQVRPGGRANFPWYDRETRWIRMRDGSARAVTVEVHPDPFVEKVRRRICEDEMVQAIGRGRGVWRTAETPLGVLILADVCLDITVDAVEAWEDPKEEEVGMAVEGVVLFSAADRAKAYPAAAYPWARPSAGAARAAAHRQGAEKLRYATLLGSLVGKRNGAFEAVRYKRAGNGQRWVEAAYAPSIIPDPKAWLESRLGPLAGFEAVGREVPVVVEAVVAAFDPRRSAKTEPAKKSVAPIRLLFDRDALDAALLDFLREDEMLWSWQAAA